MENKYITVTELNRYLYFKFDEDVLLRNVLLQGEISNFKSSGPHYYFSLKDENSEISAMFFNFARSNLHFIPQDGMSVQVRGKIQIYQKRGTYAIIISEMEEIGLGILYQKYLQLKEKLTAEGLFDEKYKKPIPEYPETVGIITAETGEAINDIVSTFNRRLPLAKLVFYPALVQGTDAPKDLIRALRLAYQNKDIDVLIIGRGGGSFEDLNCFNDEELARTLFEAPFPTVSAVGHEGDYTICDFVCSFRAPTPTGAAMKLTKVKDEVAKELTHYSTRLVNAIKKSITDKYNSYSNLASKYCLANFDEILDNQIKNVDSYISRLKLLTPENVAANLDKEIDNNKKLLINGINNKISELDSQYQNYLSRLRIELINDRIINLNNDIINYNDRINQSFNLQLRNYDEMCNHLIEKMTILNPLNIIKKGYTVVYKDDNIIYNAAELSLNDKIKVRFSDGTVSANITDIEKE